MPSNIEAIMRLEVPLIVQIAKRRMSVDEVVGLTPGAIVELPKPAGEDLEILVNNKPVGTGRAVTVGRNFGVRVAWVGNLADRIAAMGADDAQG